jgi:mono/diheme cytochrome c family protein
MHKAMALAISKYWPGTVIYTCLAFLAALAISACSDGTDSLPSASPVPTELVRGQHIFATYCAGCHFGGSGPSLINRNLSRNKIETTVRHGDGMMPSFGAGSISDNDLSQLVDYVQSLRR